MLTPTLTVPEKSGNLERTSYCLQSACVKQTDGTGPTVDLGVDRADLLVISMGINHITENEQLVLSIWGSPDGESWGDKPLLAFPPKSYCGVYSTFLNLAERPEVRYLRASWNMLRWGRGNRIPLFGFYVHAQESSTRAARSAGI